MWKRLFTIMLSVAFIACQESSSLNAEQKGAEPRQKIVVAYTYQPQSTLVHVAVAKGYFASEGLDVQPIMHTYGKAALQSVLENKADFATVAETPIVFTVLNGEKIFVIANIEASNSNNAIVARKDAGITALSDLQGKRIGFTPGTTSDFFLDSLLTANGLTRPEIQAIALKPEEMQAAIMSKQVDAISTWNYPLTQIKTALGAAGILFYDREIYTETFNLVAQQDFVQKNPDTVKRFLRALIKAENFVASNQDAAQDIMSAATKADKTLIRQVWDSFNYHVVLGQTILITLEDETRWAMKNKLTDRTVMPDYMSYMHFDSLHAVKPDAITMNR